VVATALATFIVAGCLAAGPPAPPAIALLIDDLGYRPVADRAALALPGPVVYAILPFTPGARALATDARRAGKTVFLHLPMEATRDNHLLGPGALLRAMPRASFTAAVRQALREVPYVSGVNNHMGSVLTGDLERMRWLMAELRAAGPLVYVDSRTTAASVAGQAAAEAHVPYVARDVFLDNEPGAAHVEARFDALLAHARAHGDAIGIAHPHPPSIAVLARRLAQLRDVELVPLAEVVRRRHCRGTPPAGSALPVAAGAEPGERGDHAAHAD
jgi:polysaccharide deacetylase 2 family uncharacterized protein YibQ